MAGGELRVRPAASAVDIDAFIRFQWDIYRNDPLWVPPVISHLKGFLDKKTGPFFEIGDAEYFLAERGGKIVGRISAHVNRAYEELHDADTGFFGFFESVDDQEVADALFETAAAWVKKRGKTRLHGPLSFSIYDEVGLLVEGFDVRPIMMHSHNPPYYERLVENWGFTKTYDWYAYRIDRSYGDTIDVEKLKAQRDLILKRNNLTISHPRRKEFLERSAEVRELFNDIWSKNWGHIPLTERQWNDAYAQLAPILRLDLLNIIMDGDEVAAFSVVSPDINLTLHKLNGKLGPVGMAKLFWDCRVRPLRVCRAVIMGVKKTHQWKRLHHAIMIQIVVNFIENHPKVEFCDCSLIPESLTQWNKTLQAYGGRRYKTFRLYDRNI